MALSTSPCRLPRTWVYIGLFVWLAVFPLAASAATYGGGSGTPDDPFLITTAEEFAMIGESPGDWGKHFRLTDDIDLSGYDETNLSMIGRWVILGSISNEPFFGSFDGNGRTISGFRFKDTQSDYVGLFQHVTGQITNLHLLGAKVVGNGFGTGTLVGYLENGSVSGCSSTRASVSGNVGAGALVGTVEGSVGTSWSDGQVAAVRYAGGLVGRFYRGTITHSYSKAEVTGHETVGGLVGIVSGENSVVDSCYARGPVEGVQYVGGLAGQVVSGTIYRSYAAGRVTADQWAGGLMGYKGVLGEVLGSLWDMEASGQSAGVAGGGRTTAEMKIADTYLTQNWDLFTTWAICEGVGYPIFFWQIPAGDLRCPDGVNFTDFVWFAAAWRHDDCGPLNWSCDGADLDGSGAVDARDLAVFSANWLVGVD